MPSLWKQDGTLHPAFERFHRCLDDDWFLLPYEWRLQRASAAALAKAGIFSASEYAAVSQGLDELEREWSGVATAPDDDAEDIHTFVEAALTAKVGDAGKKIHTGRSRNDQVATLLQLFLVDRAGQIVDALGELVGCHAQRALDWADVQMPLQTHAQFAAPGSAGAWALRHAIAFDRDRRTLQQAVAMWRSSCALGSGAVAGSSIPLDRQLMADRLGFDAPSPSALESTGTRDESLQLLGWSTTFALHVQAFSADVLQFMQTPFRWLRPLDGLMTGSSMMPNKSNPDGLELLRGEANALHGAFVQTLTTLKGLGSGYNRDLQCLKPVLRDSIERIDGLIALVEQHVARMSFDEQRLAAECREGEIQATLRMEREVRAGRTLRDAHHAEADRVKAGEAVAAADDPELQATAYETFGAASPAETRRLARALLATVRRPIAAGSTS